MKDSIRTFIAIAIPDTVKATLLTIQGRLKPYDLNVRWSDPKKTHLTLNFLGDIRKDQVTPICEILHQIPATSDGTLDLAVKGLGVFPGVKRPRVIWAGLVGRTDMLKEFQMRIASPLADMGFKREIRPFKPHLTLGRFKGGVDSRRLVAAMAKWGDFAPVDFMADKVVLFKSDLKPGGAVYTPLCEVALKGRGQ